MPLTFLLDENASGKLWHGIVDYNQTAQPPLEIVRVGDFPDLRRGTKDPLILIWAERHERILITNDRESLAAHLIDHLNAGGHSPGIFQLRHRRTISDVLEFLATVAHASEAHEWRDRIEYIP